MELAIAGVGTLLGVLTLYAGYSRELWDRPRSLWHVVRIAFTGGFSLWGFLSDSGLPQVPACVFGLATLVWLYKHVTSYFARPPAWVGYENPRPPGVLWR